VSSSRDLARVARGRWGEERAAAWYVARGYDVVDRNWRCPPIGELDLVVAREDVIAFVEVKARADDRFGPPSAAVGVQKQRRIRRLAASWLQQPGRSATPGRRRTVRFDVVSVTGVRVEVIESAF
jgi:putative endonuclease